MDEADRMIDMGFEEDVRTIFSFFKVGSPELYSASNENTRASLVSADDPFEILFICSRIIKLRRMR
jgi:superfamily II DNA/RNA helicase